MSGTLAYPFPRIQDLGQHQARVTVRLPGGLELKPRCCDLWVPRHTTRPYSPQASSPLGVSAWMRSPLPASLQVIREVYSGCSGPVGAECPPPPGSPVHKAELEKVRACAAEWACSQLGPPLSIPALPERLRSCFLGCQCPWREAGAGRSKAAWLAVDGSC